MTRELASPAALLLCGALLAGSACRAPAPKPVVPPIPLKEHRVKMDPVRFRVDPTGRVVTEFLDPRSLFEDADRFYREKKFELAVRRYRLLLERHPKTSYLVVSLYNLGLALEKLGRCNEAVTEYRRLVAHVPRKRDAVDASFRLATCLATLTRWREVVDLLTPLLLRADLKPVDRFEARVRKGQAHLEVGELNDAERTLLRAVRLYQEAARREPLGERRLLAEAFFHLGQVARKRMIAVDLGALLPQPEVARRLNRKGRLLLVSQARFLRAVRTADNQWAPAAGHQLGALYERFHREIMGAPVPPQLNERERAVYRDELRRKVRPLIRKAIGIYQRNLRLSERLRSDGPWVSRTRERMERLKRLLNGTTPSAAVGGPALGASAAAGNAQGPGTSPQPSSGSTSAKSSVAGGAGATPAPLQARPEQPPPKEGRKPGPNRSAGKDTIPTNVTGGGS